MCWIVRLCIVILLAGGTATAVMAEPSPLLRCVTFNLLHGGVFSGLTGDAQDLDRRLELVVGELRALQVDVVGLQEASTGRGRGNVAERLATQLGFHYVYAPASFRLFRIPAIDRLTAWVINLTEGPAIVSRFPIVSWQAYDLPRCGRFTDSRVLLYAELQTPWGLLPVSSSRATSARPKGWPPSSPTATPPCLWSSWGILTPPSAPPP